MNQNIKYITLSSARIYLHYLTLLNVDGNRLKYIVHDKTISEYLLLLISRTRKNYQPCPDVLDLIDIAERYTTHKL